MRRRRAGTSSPPYGGVKQHDIVERDAALVGMHESGDGIDQRRLARAGAPEQGGDTAGALEPGVEVEPAQRLQDANGEHQGPARRRARRRATAPETSSAANAMATAMAVSRNAAAAPLGTAMSV